MKIEYKFKQFLKDVENLSNQIKKYNPDCLIPIARGGLTLGHFLGEKLNIRDVFAINSIHYEKDKKLDYLKIKNIPNLKGKKRVVLIDDISDSGETLEGVKKVIKNKYPNIKIKVATIFYKSTSKVIPDFKIRENREWILFFWENY
jgi:xanthine phosphoribosyltransferase